MPRYLLSLEISQRPGFPRPARPWFYCQSDSDRETSIWHQSGRTNYQSPNVVEYLCGISTVRTLKDVATIIG